MMDRTGEDDPNRTTRLLVLKFEYTRERTEHPSDVFIVGRGCQSPCLARSKYREF
jgi:hypothetical protein